MLNTSVVRNASEIQRQFVTGRPFRHVLVEAFLDEKLCAALLRDFPAFDKRYAMNELGVVGGKAVVERIAKLSPAYGDFYRYVNSQAFLDAMSQITGIPDLIADKTLFGGGAHENRDGQALDVHVDFNIDERRMLHRRLNLLIYLNEEWDDDWGGAIEFHSNPRDPANDQVTSVLPLFNRAVLFETNEYSWHGFKRINLPANKKHLSRKSLSIYLYTKDRPPEEVVGSHTTFYVADPVPQRITTGYTLTEDDVRELEICMARRDGLLEMYQKLLVEKQEQLDRFVSMHQDGTLDHHVVLSSRSWRLLMSLQRLKYRLHHAFAK